MLAEGLRALRDAFPETPLVADLKTMDGGYLEAEMMAGAGATHVVVMARAYDATIRRVVEAGQDFGLRVMGDNLACRDKVVAARRLEDLGCDYVIHHIGYDERIGGDAPSPLDQLREVAGAVRVPVQAIRAPSLGAPLVVIGAPLTIDAAAFRVASGDVEGVLRQICSQAHAMERPTGP